MDTPSIPPSIANCGRRKSNGPKETLTTYAPKGYPYTPFVDKEDVTVHENEISQFAFKRNDTLVDSRNDSLD
jgi:hypothetical protein